jgi:ADP-ribose pyrophosphatase YjhB (NUDIX family)
MQSPHAWQRTTLIQHSHCSYCGTAFPDDAPWPRICPGCTETTWRNPLPVAVLMLPVRTGPDTAGLVVIRRDIEPARGQLALPGGFVETGETWQEAAVRELREEAGLTGDPKQVTLVDVVSTYGTINVFGRLPEVDLDDLPVSAPTEEATEWVVLTRAAPLAFPSHTEIASRYFASA